MKVLFLIAAMVATGCAAENAPARPRISIHTRQAIGSSLVAAKPTVTAEMTNEEKFKTFLQCFYGFFAVGLLAYPAMYFRDTALVPMVMTFWEGAIATNTAWFARAFGLQMGIMCLGPNLGVPTEAFFKQMMIANLGSIILFSWIIFFTEGVGVNWYMGTYLPVFAACAAGCKHFLK